MDARGNSFGPEERIREKSKADPTAPPVRILSSLQFVADFVPPDYLVDGILQRGYFYSLTAHPAGGKTAIVLLIAAHVGLGRCLGSREVQQGNVLILCGENPDDCRMRWIGMGEEASFDVDMIPVHFMPGIFDVAAQWQQIEKKASALDGVALVTVDTAPAYFQGDDENNNPQAGAHARKLRTLTTLPGRPTVIANCHPTKSANSDSLIPRGGGAFLGEVDGNLTSVREDRVVRLHWASKIRGPDFEAVPFELVTIRTPRIVDSKGRQLPTVMARPLTPVEETNREDEARKDEDVILAAMKASPGASLADLAATVGWTVGAGGSPYKSKVERVLKRLEKEKLVNRKRGKWRLTKDGKEGS